MSFSEYSTSPGGSQSGDALSKEPGESNIRAKAPEAVLEVKQPGFNWTTEQRRVLLARVEDWKTARYRKPRGLVVEGAIADLQKLVEPPSGEDLRKVDLQNLSVILS